MTHRELLERSERCFDPGEVETLLWRSEGGTVERSDAAVKVVHRESGIEIIEDQSLSQIENKAAALIRVLKRLHGNASSET